jgi:hypothetical protein
MGRPPGRPVRVAVDLGHPGPTVPTDFVGLSFEARNLPTLAALSNRGNLVELLRALGPGWLRFGGVSADKQTAWVGDGARRPPWATYSLGASDLRGLAGLASRAGWRVLLTVNLGHYDPPAAAREIAAARRALGRDLAAVEIGNEPDAYVPQRLRSPPWGYRAYRAQADAYLAAIRSVAPGIAVAAPDASSGVPPLRWVSEEAASGRPALLTDHFYPSSSCGYKPVVSDLLSPVTRRIGASMLARLAAISGAAHTPLRVDETNSISCHGQPGVSNSFASALWALDYLSRAMRAGLGGVNFHDLILQPLSYSPIAGTRAQVAAGALNAEPVFYALLMARQLAGGRLLPAGVSPATTSLSASAALASRSRLQVLLVDYDEPGAAPRAVHLGVPARFFGGTVLRLRARSPAATAGVTLGGRAVGADGRWRPATRLPGLYGPPGGLSVGLAPGSAALVTLYPRR